MDRLHGILNASPEKRYKNFISTVVDLEEVWVLSSEDGYATWDEGEIVRLIVFPTHDSAVLFSENDVPESIEIHDFISRCTRAAADDKFGFMVYPNGINSYVVSTDRMIQDLMDELELIE
jgi:hypothetical protein